MKYKILLPLLVSVALLNACSKSDSQTELPGDTILESYYPGSNMEINELAIHTKNGVVTDATTIQNFIERNVNSDVRSQYHVGATSIPVPASTQVLHILNNNRVNINGVNMEITGYKDSVMIVSEYTTSSFPTYSSTCGALLGKTPEYTAYTNCPDANCATYRRTYPILKSGVNYFAPLLTYTVVTKDCAITPTEIPAINFVNTDLNSLLGEGDSVLIQYAKLPLVKKSVQ